jgi:hypothetical protein
MSHLHEPRSGRSCSSRPRNRSGCSIRRPAPRHQARLLRQSPILDPPYASGSIYFLSRDPIGQLLGLNGPSLPPSATALGRSWFAPQPYGYADDDPLNATDPTGWGCFHPGNNGEVIFVPDAGPPEPLEAYLGVDSSPVPLPPDFRPDVDTWFKIGSALVGRFGTVRGIAYTVALIALVLAHNYYDDVQQLIQEIRNNLQRHCRQASRGGAGASGSF